MDQFVKKFTHDFSYSFLLNVVNLVVKSSFVFILPKIIGVAEFGYWQLYFLYTFFIAFGHLGLVDGIYLKYGGKFYGDLDLQRLRSQFWVLLGMGVLWNFILLLYIHLFLEDFNKAYILTIVAFDLVLTLPRTLLSIIFQMTGMIKQYAFSLMSESIFSFAIIAIMVIAGIKDYKLFILVDLIARFISLCVSLINAPGFIGKCSLGFEILRESVSNISIGIYLLLSNMVGLVVVASVRFAIESKWGIILFSKISLAFSVASVAVTAISAVGIVLFPLLRRLKRENLEESFSALSLLLMFLLVVCMCVYYPGTLLLQWWLPKYSESIYYLSIVLPMTFFDTQFIVVGSNFLKVIRKERSLFAINVSAVAFTIIVILLTAIFRWSVECLLIGLVMQSLLKCLLTVHTLGRFLQHINSDTLVTGVLVTGLFALSNIMLKGVIGFFTYVIGCLILVFIYRKKIQYSWMYLKSNE